jgi:superoxide dismutase
VGHGVQSIKVARAKMTSWMRLASRSSCHFTSHCVPDPAPKSDRPPPLPLLLLNAVWEHAYYIDWQNKRGDFITTFMNDLICWEIVAERYARATASK